MPKEAKGEQSLGIASVGLGATQQVEQSMLRLSAAYFGFENLWEILG